MKCDELARWIGPLLDGELDAKNTVEVQAHLDACPDCTRRYEAQTTLSRRLRGSDLRLEAPAALRESIFAAVLELEGPVSSRGEDGRRETGASRWVLLAGWPVAAAACAILATLLLHERGTEANDIVAAHVRSLQVDHLSDVVSTDHHTVKPWFAGKIDFAPPVPDLRSLGFELVGGRLDYLQDQPVAALVYRKHGHIINVLVRPGEAGVGLPHVERVRGYTLRSWRQAGLNVVAVSDIDPLELEKLEQGYRAPMVPAGEPSGRSAEEPGPAQ